jgi:hypothetical protein
VSGQEHYLTMTVNGDTTTFSAWLHRSHDFVCHAASHCQGYMYLYRYIIYQELCVPVCMRHECRGASRWLSTLTATCGVAHYET